MEKKVPNKYTGSFFMELLSYYYDREEELVRFVQGKTALYNNQDYVVEWVWCAKYHQVKILLVKHYTVINSAESSRTEVVFISTDSKDVHAPTLHGLFIIC